MLPRYCPEVRSTKFKPAHRRTWLPCSNRRKSPPKAMMAGLSGREMPMGRTRSAHGMCSSTAEIRVSASWMTRAAAAVLVQEVPKLPLILL